MLHLDSGKLLLLCARECLRWRHSNLTWTAVPRSTKYIDVGALFAELWLTVRWLVDVVVVVVVQRVLSQARCSDSLRCARRATCVAQLTAVLFCRLVERHNKPEVEAKDHLDPEGRPKM
jgi:hypothetical protein